MMVVEVWGGARVSPSLIYDDLITLGWPVVSERQSANGVKTDIKRERISVRPTGDLKTSLSHQKKLNCHSFSDVYEPAFN